MKRTPLGRELMKLRVDKGMTLTQMAQQLNISPAYLSAVEIGKQKPSNGLMRSLVSRYSEIKTRENEFVQLATLSSHNIKIDISVSTEVKKHFALMLQSHWNTIPTNAFAEMNNIIETQMNAYKEGFDANFSEIKERA